MKTLDQLSPTEFADVATVDLSSDKLEQAKRRSTMPISIHKVAVLGAGTMGARIAAHLANAGTQCVLLDIVPTDPPPTIAGDAPVQAARNRIVNSGLETARKSKPASFFESSLTRYVKVGNFEDDLKLIADADWIIEAVAENL